LSGLVANDKKGMMWKQPAPILSLG